VSVTLDWTIAPFCAVHKVLKLSSDGGDSGSEKCKRETVVGGVDCEVWRSLRLAGVWSQAAGILLVRLASYAMEIFHI
jgi:hypothetical protein